MGITVISDRFAFTTNLTCILTYTWIMYGTEKIAAFRKLHAPPRRHKGAPFHYKDIK